jgi:DNA modification methylase
MPSKIMETATGKKRKPLSGEHQPAQMRRSDSRKANALDGRTWTRYSVSIWSDIRKTPAENALRHPAMFPAELPARLIEIFTRGPEARVLDPFAGTGSTLVAARRLGRSSVGIEISEKYTALARERLRQMELFDGDCAHEAAIYQADARDVLRFAAPDSIDLVITSPPYWDILTRDRTADYKERRDYEAPEDIGKIPSYEEFLDSLKSVFAAVHTTLKCGAYCCVIVMDIRKKNRFFPFHSDLARRMQEIGFIFDDLIIWDRRHEYNNLRPLGYPAVFRINKTHEYILLFLKPGE